MKSNFLSAKEQKKLIEQKVSQSASQFMEKGRFDEFQNQSQIMLEHHSEKHNCHEAKLVDVDAEIDYIKKRLDKKANEDEL